MEFHLGKERIDVVTLFCRKSFDVLLPPVDSLNCQLGRGTGNSVKVVL
jgi:hypothetical protein